MTDEMRPVKKMRLKQLAFRVRTKQLNLVKKWSCKQKEHK